MDPSTFFPSCKHQLLEGSMALAVGQTELLV